LERFARGALPQAAAEEFRRFEQLLGLPDPVLAGYFLGGGRPADPGIRGRVTFWAARGRPTRKSCAWSGGSGLMSPERPFGVILEGQDPRTGDELSLEVTVYPAHGAPASLEGVGARMSADVSDLSLVRRVQRGDKGAFDALVLKYQHKLVKLVMRYVRNPAEAEDIAQEAFIKAYRALPQFRGDSAFYTWLYRI